MNELFRELAPITPEGWQAIETEARRTLETWLAARKLVDFSGPHGWQFDAVRLGEVDGQGPGLVEGGQTQVRRVQPLCELRVPFTVDRALLDAIARGAEAPELEAVVEAARRIALGEDRAVFHGYGPGQMAGLVEGSTHAPLALRDNYADFPALVADALEVLREAGVHGPYALALGADAYTGLARTLGPGGYPVIQHVRKLLEGSVVWAPALQGAVLVSTRGGDHELVVGRDVSIGYLDHDTKQVRLYLEESFTFRLLSADAAVAMR